MVQLTDIGKSGYERVVRITDSEVGLDGFIAVHSTRRGPGLGGLRFRRYQDREDALGDVLRLAEAMTYKAAAAGLPFGGGKAVIMGDARRDKTPELLSGFGRAVESLNGHYIAAEDVGTSPEDMAVVAQATHWVAGLPTADGGSGDPSPATAVGVLRSMHAVAKYLWGVETLQDRRVVIQGVGKVGASLVEKLLGEGARVSVADVDRRRIDELRQSDLDFEVVDPKSSLYVECDILSPCALGGILTESTILHLRCEAIVGSANNQLQGNAVSDSLAERGIVYVPDFIANAGGIINIASEFGYTESAVSQALFRIGDTTERVLRMSESTHISTYGAAMELARRAIASR